MSDPIEEIPGEEDVPEEEYMDADEAQLDDTIDTEEQE